MSTNIAIARIALDTTTIGRKDFATVAFGAKHNLWKEPARFVTSASDLIQEGVSEFASVYKAVSVGLQQEDRPEGIWIGRIVCTSEFAYEDAAIIVGKQYGLSLEVEATGAPVAIIHTAIASDTAETVSTALKALIDANADLLAVIDATVVGAGVDAKLVLGHKDAETWFVTSTLVNTVQVGSTTEQTGAEWYASFKDVADFYYLTAEEKDSAFVQSLSTIVESEPLGMYRVSIAEAGAYDFTISGTLADVRAVSPYRTHIEYHHLAETDFPEVAALCEIVNKKTGRVTWANRKPKGVVEAKQVDGSNLTSTHLTNLSRNKVPTFLKVGITGSDNGPVITTQGKVASGEHSANIPARDNLKVDLEGRLTDVLVNQMDGRISYTAEDFQEIETAIIGVIDDYVDTRSHDFINADYEVFMPDPSKISAVDKSNNVLKGITFKATLKGAVHIIELSGSLTL